MASRSLFALVRQTLGSDEEIEILEEDYESLIFSRDVLSEVCDFEEKFLLVCEQYKTFEQFIFEQNINNMLYNNYRIPDMDLVGLKTSSHIVSLLSVVKLYIDSTRAKFLKETPDFQERGYIDSIFTSTYDNSHEYRVIESIRNFSQHKDLPVHSASYTSCWIDDKSEVRYSSEFFFDYNKIGKDKYFKKAVLKELLDHNKKVNLIQYIRVYFREICNIHSRIRMLTSDIKQASNSIIEKFRSRWYQEFSDDRMIGVVACKLNETIIDNAFRIIHIGKDIDEYRKHIEMTTIHLAKMSSRKVSF